MKDKRRPLLIFIGALALIAVIVLVAIDRSHVKYQFPMWEEATEQEGRPEVSIKLAGIDFGVESEDRVRDIVHVIAHSDVEQMTFGVDFWVDYLSDGKWYTVYQEKEVVEIARILGLGDNSLEYDVPEGLFRQKGQYRLYVSDLGFCEIDMTAALKD